MDGPLVFIVSIVVLILIFGQAYIWRRGINKRRADGTIGAPIRITRGTWVVIAGVAVLFVVFVVLVPLIGP